MDDMRAGADKLFRAALKAANARSMLLHGPLTGLGFPRRAGVAGWKRIPRKWLCFN